MKVSRDAYGQQLLAQYNSRTATCEIIERDDYFIDTGSEAGLYFSEYEQWSSLEQQAIALAQGRILDIGCGAGRHSLYLQENGFDVTGIDNSTGAIEVCKLRGLRKIFVRPIIGVDKFKPDSFDTVIMLGNNFGLFGGFKQARAILEKLYRVTAPAARIIAQSRNPHITIEPEHLQYLKLNERRGRMPGQLRIRARFGRAIGEWFDYLFVSPSEMSEILGGTNWQIEKFTNPEDAQFFAVIEKKSL